MTKEKPINPLGAMETGINQTAASSAPVIFADSIPFLGHSPGIVRVTLAARLPLPGNPEGVDTAVAHLRLPVEVARVLILTLEKAITNAEAPTKPAGTIN